MNDKIRSLGLLGSIGIACVLCGCSGSPDESADAQGASPPSSDDLSGTTSSSATTPVATLTLENGNRLEFYDFGDRALVMETGVAGVAPIVDLDSGSDNLVTTWDRYANGSPAPLALRKLEAKIAEAAASGNRVALDQEPVVQALPASGAPESVEKSPMGCNNGCCDPVYLESELGCGNRQGKSSQVYFFNKNWTIWNSTQVVTYEGTVCAAIGTTTFNVDIGGRGGSWPVWEATWRRYRWTADFRFIGGYQARTMNTSTSGESGSTMHSYCGWIILK